MNTTEHAARAVSDFTGEGVRRGQFIDYDKLGGDSGQRKVEKEDFIADKAWAPAYDYPRLTRLFDDLEKGSNEDNAVKVKAFAAEALLRLDQAVIDGEIQPDEAELYLQYYEVRLKRVLLIEAMKRLGEEGRSSQSAPNRQAIIELGTDLYGEFDTPTYEGMMSTEAVRVDEFQPGNDRATSIKNDLVKFFEGVPRHNEEPELLDAETMHELREIIVEEYGHILAVVPDTDDSVVYDAKQCREIMQQALQAGELAAKGWVVEIDDKKSNVATNADKKIIFLPTNTNRTASQLRRLILHEQEVHGRRGQNGAESKLAILGLGTADYADVEEGLGVLLECILEGNFDNASFHRARNRYLCAGLALGATGPARDGRQTYEILWRLLAVQGAKDGVVDEAVEERAKTEAYTHVENAFRGTNFAMPGVIYSKLKVYYEGLQKNARYFMRHKRRLREALSDSMIGKANHTDPEEMSRIRSLAA